MKVAMIHVEAAIDSIFEWLFSSQDTGHLIVVRRHLLDADRLLQKVKSRASVIPSVILISEEKRRLKFQTKSGNMRIVSIIRRINNPTIPSDGVGVLVTWDDDDLLSRGNCDPTQTIVVPIKTED